MKDKIKKILVICPYPENTAPGQRLKYEQYFDFLRDNMKFEIEQIVQRPFNFAIVDEVDSILIDEVISLILTILLTPN